MSLVCRFCEKEIDINNVDGCCSAECSDQFNAWFENLACGLDESLFTKPSPSSQFISLDESTEVSD